MISPADACNRTTRHAYLYQQFRECAKNRGTRDASGDDEDLSQYPL